MQAVQKYFCYGPKECLFLLKKNIPKYKQIYSYTEDYIYMHTFIMTFYLAMTLFLYFESFIMNALSGQWGGRSQGFDWWQTADDNWSGWDVSPGEYEDRNLPDPGPEGTHVIWWDHSQNYSQHPPDTGHHSIRVRHHRNSPR